MTTTRDEDGLEPIAVATPAAPIVYVGISPEVKAKADQLEAKLRVMLSTPATEPQGYVEGLEAALRPFASIVDKRKCKITLTWKDGDYVSTYTDVLKPAHFYAASDALAARPTPQPAADTRVTDAMILEIWSLAQQYDDFDSAFRSKIRAIIGNATPAPSDKSAEAARVLDASDEVKTYLDGVIGVVEANSFESMCLWQARGSRTWVSSGCGYGATVGKLDGRPVALSLTTSIIDGHKVAFTDATSEVVDWPLIEAWLQKNLPPTAMSEDGRVNKTNAMNFSNVFPRALAGKGE